MQNYCVASRHIYKIHERSEYQNFAFCILHFEFRKGFTLLEIVIVVALIALLVFLAIPISLRFYRVQTLDDARQNLITTMERARAQAIAQKNDAAFGVKILSSGFVLFQGVSYARRQVEEDEVFSFPAGVNPGGLSEIVFNKLIGDTVDTGTVTLTVGSESRSIIINSKGIIY